MEDDEIIIGIETKKTPKKNNKKKLNSSSKVKSSNSKSQKKPISKKSRMNKPIQSKSRIRVFKMLGIIILILGVSVLLLSSSLFDIKNIEISGNNKLSDKKIISLSSLELYTNIFKFRKNEIKENLKENAYIEEVKITRKYPNSVNIEIVEREPRYMLQFADSYVYINNQGYMLDISNEKLDIPILVGFTTDLSNIKAGNRINVDDLKKMNNVIKIYDSATANELNELITKIDISNSKNYTIELETKGKIVYLGDCEDYADLKNRMLYLKALLEQSDGKKGEIFLNVDLNSERIYFRESVG